LEPLSGFNDDQLSYLKDKFEILCDETKLLSVDRIAEAFKCSRGEASKILSYIDFENHNQVDFYEFTCAAASLHQNDDDAFEFLYDLYGNGG
jgi:Ca2+-binding EF-hand superfamily protein